MSINLRYFPISQNISADLKGPKVNKNKLQYGRCTELLLGPPHDTTPTAVKTNKNIKMSSFKSSERGGQDRPVSNNCFSSVTLNELAMKARENSKIASRDPLFKALLA